MKEIEAIKEQDRETIISAIRRRVDLIVDDVNWFPETVYTFEKDYLKDEVSAFTGTTTACVLLNIDPENWDKRLRNYKLSRRNDYLDQENFHLALEIDKLFIGYLIRVGKIDEAIKTSKNVVRDYKLRDKKPSPDIQSLRAEIINHAATKLISAGEIGKSNILIGEINETDLRISYYYSLINYFEQNSNFSGLESLLEQLKNRLGLAQTSDDHDINAINHISYAISHAENSINNLKSKTSLRETIQEILEVPFPPYVVQKLKGLAKTLAEKGEWAKAKEVATLMLDILHENSSYKKMSDSNQAYLSSEETYGDISFSAKEPSPNTNLVSAYNTLLERASFVVDLSKFSNFEDLIQRAIEGDDLDGKYSLLEVIKLIKSDSQPSAWSLLIQMYASLDNWGEVQEIFDLAVENFPNSRGFFEQTVALKRMPIDENDAENRILEIENKDSKLTAYAEFIHEKFSRGESLGNWRIYIDKLYAIESEIIEEIETQGEQDWDLSTLDTADIENTNTGFLVPKKSFWGSTTEVMCNLAKMALIKNEYQIFADIINDPRLKNYFLPMLLEEIAEWLVSKRPFEFWY